MQAHPRTRREQWLDEHARESEGAARPAPLPVIAMQQSAGNAAVGRVLQRMRFSDGEPSHATTTGTPLEPGVRQPMEHYFGTDLSSVAVHRDSAAPEELGAHAYAKGDALHFAPGKYDPGSAGGQDLLAHELAHVVQQRQGRVQPTGESLGLPVNGDPGLERESQTAASEVAAGGQASGAGAPAAVARTGGVIQLAKFGDHETALSWLEGKEVDTGDDAALRKLITEDKTYGKPVSHIEPNLKTLKAAIAKAAKSTKKTAKSVRATAPKGPKREVPADVMTHVVDGVIKEDGVPAGFHSVKGARPVAVKTGVPVPKENGCYWTEVSSATDPSKKKKLGSTFFPDTWTEAQIKRAIEYADEVKKNKEYVTTAEAPLADIPLYFNGVSYYPNYR